MCLEEMKKMIVYGSLRQWRNLSVAIDNIVTKQNCYDVATLLIAGKSIAAKGCPTKNEKGKDEHCFIDRLGRWHKHICKKEVDKFLLNSSAFQSPDYLAQITQNQKSFSSISNSIDAIKYQLTKFSFVF